MAKRENYMSDQNSIPTLEDDLQEFIRHEAIGFARPERSALLVIDMQNFFTDESSHAFIPSIGSIIPKINALIELYSTTGLPILFSRHGLLEGEHPGIMAEWWSDTVMEGTKQAELAPDLTVPEDAIVFRKTTYDCFHGTELHRTLTDLGVKTLAITGVMTHLCCETTARAAFVRDFQVLFVMDATATVNRDLHLSTLRTLADGFAVPCTTADLIATIKADHGGGV